MPDRRGGGAVTGGNGTGGWAVHRGTPSLGRVTVTRVPAGIDLTDLDRFADGFPHEVFTRLRAEAPVAWHEPTATTPGGEGFWVITRHADVTAVAGDGAGFVSGVCPARPDGGGTLIEDQIGRAHV